MSTQRSNVVLLSSPQCPHCVRLRGQVRATEKGRKLYDSIRVVDSNSPEASKWSFSGVPTMFVDGKQLSGAECARWFSQQLGFDVTQQGSGWAGALSVPQKTAVRAVAAAGAAAAAAAAVVWLWP